MRKIAFIRVCNRNKIKNHKEYTLIYTDHKSKENKSLEKHIKIIADKANQDINGYKIEWTQKWSFKKHNGRSFAEKLILEDQSQWYQLEFLLHFNPLALSHEIPICKMLLLIDTINHIIDKYKPSEVLVENNKTPINKLILLVCSKRGIKVNITDIKPPKERLLTRIINNPLTIRNYLSTRILIRRILSLLFCKTYKNSDILILTSDRLSNKENKTDHYWGTMVGELDREGLNYKMIEYDRMDILSSLTQIFKRYVPQKYDAQFIGTYYTRNTKKEMKKIRRFFKNKFKELTQNQEFKNSLQYRGINFYDLLLPRLKKIFITYSAYISDVNAICKSIINKERPKLVMVDHEKNYYGRALITEAKINNIPSVCFEGETIYGNNTYLAQTQIKGISNKKSPLWRPVPDIKFVWGSYSKEWHTKKYAFPEENVKVIGSPKYDYCKHLGKKEKEKYRKTHDIGNKSTIIGFFTSISFPEERFFIELLKTVKTIKNAKLVVKSHPSLYIEKYWLIKRLLKKYGIDGIITKTDNCGEIINASDLIITIASTIIYEAIMMKKKILFMSVTETDPQQPYIKENLISPVLNPADMDETIRAYLKNRSINKKKYEEFIKKYLYSDDGKSSERAIKQIENMLN